MSEITVGEAMRVLNRDYFDDVRGAIEEMKRAVKDGEVTSDEELSEHLHEFVDGHQRVIYTHQARVGLCCSDHPDAYFEEMGENNSGDVSAQMYFAFRADIQDRLYDYETIVDSLEAEKGTE